MKPAKRVFQKAIVKSGMRVVVGGELDIPYDGTAFQVELRGRGIWVLTAARGGRTYVLDKPHDFNDIGPAEGRCRNRLTAIHAASRRGDPIYRIR